jgi:hypothetical protein
MRTPSQVVRLCAIVIPLLHLAIFVSLFFPYDSASGETVWQALFPTNFLRDDLYFFVILALILLGALALPPLVSWAAARSPVRMMSLVSVWVSLPLTLVAWLFCTVQLWSLVNGFRSASRLAIFVPPLGFVLSFAFCLVLAPSLPRLLAHEQAALARSRPEHLTSAQDERAERVHASEGETRPKYAGTGRFLPSLAVSGLLCHLLVFLSLFFSSTETYDPYMMATFYTTGWQVLLGGDIRAFFLLPVLILPIFPYLFCLLLIPLKSEWKDVLLRKSFALNGLLNMVGFVLIIVTLAFSLIGDFNKENHRLDAASGIPLAAFLLSLICSSVLFGHFLQRRTEARLL